MGSGVGTVVGPVDPIIRCTRFEMGPGVGTVVGSVVGTVVKNVWDVGTVVNGWNKVISINTDPTTSTSVTTVPTTDPTTVPTPDPFSNLVHLMMGSFNPLRNLSTDRVLPPFPRKAKLMRIAVTCFLSPLGAHGFNIAHEGRERGQDAVCTYVSRGVAGERGQDAVCT